MKSGRRNPRGGISAVPTTSETPSASLRRLLAHDHSVHPVHPVILSSCPNRSSEACRATLRPQLVVEEFHRTQPGQLRSSLVVAWGRVIVEAVLGASIDIRLIFDPGRFQRRLECRQPGENALVLFSVVDQQRCLDARDLLRGWGAAIERYRRAQARKLAMPPP